MYLAEYHCHSRCSPDGWDSMAAIAEAAVAAGVSELCFTDHADAFDWCSKGRRTELGWGVWERDFREAQALWGDRIRLRLGAELGDANRDEGLVENMLAQGPELDFLIGSIHTLSPAFGGADLYFMEERNEGECRAVIADYLGELLRIVRWGRFHVLGHLTLPLRYMNENRGFSMSFDGFEAEVAEVLRAAIDKGIGIELNANRGNLPLPDGKWLRLYRELGGEIITLGSDAHRAADVARGVRAGQALLCSCGFTRFCTFEKGQPVFHAL